VISRVLIQKEAWWSLSIYQRWSFVVQLRCPSLSLFSIYLYLKNIKGGHDDHFGFDFILLSYGTYEMKV
jgi:hypothetical protein